MVALYIYVILMNGTVIEQERIPMAPVIHSLGVRSTELEMCLALKHQREFTHYTPQGALGIFHICREEVR